MTNNSYREPTTKDLYVRFLWQAITQSHYAPCGANELEEAARLANELISEHGEEFDLRSINKEVINLIINDEEPDYNDSV